MDFVKKHPEKADLIITAKEIKDRCFANKGWNKMSRTINGIEIHFMAKFDKLGKMIEVTDFKFK